MDFFSFIENIYTKKYPVTTSDENQLDGEDSYYMVIRWLSMHPISFVGAYKATKLSRRLPKSVIGCLLYNSVKKQKTAPTIRYIKKEKKEKDKEILNKIMLLFQCGEKHAEEIIVIFERNGIEIRKAFGLK